MVPQPTSKSASLPFFESQILINSKDLSNPLPDSTKIIWFSIGVLVAPQAG